MFSSTQKFIITSDIKTIAVLKQAGFKQVGDFSDGVARFLNNPPKNFSFDKIDKKKILFTNILTV